MQCRSHAGQLSRLYKDFLNENCEVLLILGAPIERAKQYANALHLPFPVLADPERSVYQRYGLGKALLVIQRTASVVVDRSGTIQYLKEVTNPIPWLEESRKLIQVVRNIR
jgi:peroxiredoxin